MTWTSCSRSPTVFPFWSTARCSSRAAPKKSPAIPASRPSISARSWPMPELLNVQGLTAGYGEAIVLSDVTFKLAEGKALALLGRNGMGKTTLVNSIIGVTRHVGGTISLDGRDITGLRPDQRAHAGIGWVPQERNIFRSLTVEENMTAVAQPGPWRSEERREGKSVDLGGRRIIKKK